MLTEAQTAFTIAATDAATIKTSRSSMKPGDSNRIRWSLGLGFSGILLK